MGTNRRDPGTPTDWELRAAWFLRILIFAGIVIHIERGEFVYAIFSLAAIAVLAAPSFLFGGSHANMPVEVELAILWGAVSDITLGRVFGLYQDTAWYDKVIHLGNAVSVGLLAFLIVYALHFTGRLSMSFRVAAGIIFLFALGFGALWEIAEFAADAVFHEGAQGNAFMDPHTDTMWDLILDGIGGAIGAIVGPLYIRNSRRTRARLAAIASWVPTSHERAE